ncbi:hypothetical protein Tco_0516372 [Tanacetum coccineum]
MAEQDIPPPTITAMKIPIIRKGEYDIWSMRMRQYICHTYHNLGDVIVKTGDLEEEPVPTTGETSAPPASKTAKQLAARRNQERVKSILLLAIPDEYLLKFHNVADAKSLWEAIKSRFGGNVHGAPISKEDINQKFLRSLPSSWNQIALIMRNKPDIDEIDIDDLYNNLKVYEDDETRSSVFQLCFLRFGLFSPLRILAVLMKLVLPVEILGTGAQYGLGGYDWSNDFELEPVNYDLMAISSSSSSSSSDSEDIATHRMKLSSNHETDSENSLSIFYVRSSDEEIIPKNDRSSKNRYKDFPSYNRILLNPRDDISFAGLDEYAIRNKIIDSQITELNTKTSETAGKPKSASESVVSNSKIDRDRVTMMIELR